MFKWLKEKLNAVADSLNGEQPVKVDALAAAHMPGDLALLVIDVQKQFCGTKGLEEKAARIQTRAAEFRAAGVAVYAIHYTEDDEIGAEDPAKIDFFKFRPRPQDKLIRKTEMSAFSGSDIESVLRRDGRKSLIACGFYTSACVRGTVLDARSAGFDVCLLEDLTGDFDAAVPPRTLKEMRRAKIEVTQSADVLQRVRVLASPQGTSPGV